MRLMLNLTGFAAVMALVLLVGLFLLPPDRLGLILSDQLTAQLGRQVRIRETRVSVWPVLGVTLSDLRVANAPWAGAAPLFEAADAGIGIDPLALLHGEIAVRSIVADGPVLRLQRRADGAANWHFGAGESAGQGTALPLTSLDSLRITRGAVSLDDVGQVTRVADADLTLSWPDRNGPAQVAARLRTPAAPLRIDAEIGAPMTLLSGEDAVPVQVALGTEGGRLSFDGLASAVLEAQGRLTLDLSDTARAAAAFGQIGLDLPQGLGRRLAGRMQVTRAQDGRIALRDGAVSLDANAVRFSADIVPGAVPRVTARIEAETLDLSGLVAPRDTDPATEGWSKTAIDASGLAVFDGEIALKTEALRVGALRFGRVRSVMTLQDRRAVVDLRELRGYDGVLTGQLVANDRGGLSMRADLAFAGVALGDLLPDAIAFGGLTGQAEGSLTLLASGQTLHTLVATLDGEGALKAGPGRLSGLDLDRALTGAAEGGTTMFDSATATFTVTGGRLVSDDLAMQVQRLWARGAGWVELAPRTIDYVVTVQDPAARGGRGLAVPVRLKGPWSAVQVRVDAPEAIEQTFATDRDALEKRVDDAVAEALKERPGVTVDAGETVEDARRHDLENRALDGLRNLPSR